MVSSHGEKKSFVLRLYRENPTISLDEVVKQSQARGLRVSKSHAHKCLLEARHLHHTAINDPPAPTQAPISVTVTKVVKAVQTLLSLRNDLGEELFKEVVKSV